MSPDHHKASQNSSNLAHASTDDLHAEMIVIKSLEVDQIYMLKTKADEKQILLNNENKALSNNFIDQIEFLKNELRSQDTIIILIIENSKYSNEYFQNKNNNDSNQNEKFVTPKKTAKLRTSDDKDLNNFASLNHFKILEDKEIDDKENQHNKLEDSISHSAGQPRNIVKSNCNCQKICILQTETSKTCNSRRSHRKERIR